MASASLDSSPPYCKFRSVDRVSLLRANERRKHVRVRLTNRA